MNKKILIIVGVVILVLLSGAGGFWGGMAYTTDQNNQVQARFFDQRGGLSTGGQFPSGTSFPGGPGTFTQGQANFRGGTMGQVKSIDGDVITISTAQNVTTVNLTDTTKILKSAEGTMSDLQPGMQVMIAGDRDDNGNITASQITIVSDSTLEMPIGAAP